MPFAHNDPVIVARLRAAGCVFAEDEAQLLISAASSDAELSELVDRRIAGLPLEQILGWAEFCGLRIAIEPDVFVPRQRTTFLVQQAAALAGDSTRFSGDRAVVVDLCCGSGAIGVAVLASAGGRERIELYAADIEPAALRCARRNIEPVGGEVYAGDLYEPLPATLRGRVDVLVCNAPYVPTDEIGLMPPEARIHEPRVTLDGGADGLDVQRRVASGAGAWLSPGGQLLIETSARQAPHTADAFAAAGLIPRIASNDELYATVVIGSRPH
jgi:release factor glutamine methyltransferase